MNVTFTDAEHDLLMRAIYARTDALSEYRKWIAGDSKLTLRDRAVEAIDIERSALFKLGERLRR
jgi:hypothetical protein